VCLCVSCDNEDEMDKTGKNRRRPLEKAMEVHAKDVGKIS
jgi:hypothetical protein